MKIQGQALVLLLLSASSAAAAGAAVAKRDDTTNHQLRGQRQHQNERELLFHVPECDDAGAERGLECLNLIKYKLEWPECVTDNLSVEECKDLIRSQILNSQHALVVDPGPAIHLHLPAPEGVADDGTTAEVTTEVVIDLVDDSDGSTDPVAVALKKEYYNRYEVPVNYAGEVQGYSVNGEVHYNNEKPWTYHCDPDWITYPTSAGGGGPPPICTQEPITWNCKGSPDANHCENHVLQSMYYSDISTRDKAGNFMTPWVRQVSPTPFHKSAGGEDMYFKETENHLGFCAWTYNASTNQYEAIEVSAEEQLSPLRESKVAAVQMKTMVEHGLTQSEFTNDHAVALVRKCHQHLRTLPDAGGICTELHYWVERYFPHNVPIKQQEEIKPYLDLLVAELDRFSTMPDRLEYKIEIHGTDAAGSGVAQTPKMGHHYSHGAPVCVPGATYH
jgi:hypothetical protein